MPEAKTFYVMLPSIHSANFLTELFEVLNSILVDPVNNVNLLVECVMEGNRYRSLAPSLHIASGFTLSDLEDHFNVRIENFEAQSGTGEEGPCVTGTRAIITNISSAPNPSAIPFTSDPANVEWKRDVKQDKKATRRPSASVSALKALSEQITSSQSSMDSKFSTLNSTMTSGFESVVQAIKTIPTSTPSPSSVSSPMNQFNWTPIIQGAITGIASSFGMNLTPVAPTSTQPSPTTTMAPSNSSIKLAPIEARLDKLESKYSTLESTLTSNLNSLTQARSEMTATISKMGQLLSVLSSSKNGGSSSSSPPEITAVSPYKGKFNLDKIVTADLESIITPEGFNQVYMAAWYNGKNTQIYDLTSYNYDSNTMLKAFWLDLINKNKGGLVYFHNWAGYDAILSLLPLLNLHEHGFTYSPIMQNGQLLSLTILQKIKGKNKSILTIKDSLKMIPGALGKLAKDFQVETQKDHFPHYFLLEGDMVKTLNYEGELPNYDYFEPKRTSRTDYDEMVKQFKGKSWSFLKVSKQYIKGDVQAQHQIIIKFFNTLKEAFPINPLTLLSAPGTAFKIWKTVQLPLLNKDSLKVYDLSRSLNNKFREAYLGGIVDVYRPYFEGQKGYYYDVNSLYPTAMCRTMPVGIPILQTLNELNPEFFGFVEATVQAPSLDKPGGYIGLLPIKHGGRLVCPGGTFSGVFFSEELRFALENGYQLINIEWAYKFQRGENTFLDLIKILNEMKIEGQVNKQPTIRNLAKLLMNSMYGRFGIKPNLTAHLIITQEELQRYGAGWLILNQIVLGKKLLVNVTPDYDFIRETKGNEERFKMLMKYANNSNVAIAGAVTSYSRILINSMKLKAIELGASLFYSDTDSIVINQELPQEMISSTKLGLLKLEHEIEEGIFVMPKVYYLETLEGKSISKCKGFSGKLSKTQYIDLLEGKPLNLTITKWDRSLKGGTDSQGNRLYPKILI